MPIYIGSIVPLTTHERILFLQTQMLFTSASFRCRPISGFVQEAFMQAQGISEPIDPSPADEWQGIDEQAYLSAYLPACYGVKYAQCHA